MSLFSIDYYIRSKYKNDSYTFRKAKLLVQTSFLTSLFSGFYLIQTYILGMTYCQFAMLYNVLSFLLIPFFFRWKMSSLWTANLYIFTGFVGVGICAVVQDILESSTIIWFALLPVVSLMLSNKRNAWVWTGIAAFTVVVLGIVHENGGLRYNESPAEFNTFLEVSNITGFILIVYLVVLVFQRATDNTLKMVDEKNVMLEGTLASLKATQTQLIQAEKMASLGELTAGIAHEIQNPLNFINNFSDVNTELNEELEKTLEEGNIVETKQLLHDLKTNQEKISHHGRRADAIVKAMLQHSRQSTGIKEPTNINILVREYLQLSYQGFRTKSADISASYKTDFDERIGKVAIVPQEIGRVFLNLFNNAFYAVAEKKRNTSGDYEPLVTVSTESDGRQVKIRISDNGGGIPQQVLDKIFQPFFTTKPTGEGTGLGLSICYDIIKMHGGELKVKSIEGEGTVFTVMLNKEEP